MFFNSSAKQTRKTSKRSKTDEMRRRAASYRALAIYHKAQASYAAGDHFNVDRLEFVRLVQMAMGAEQHRAGYLIEAAFEGHPSAMFEIFTHLEQIVYDAG